MSRIKSQEIDYTILIADLRSTVNGIGDLSPWARGDVNRLHFHLAKGAPQAHQVLSEKEVPAMVIAIDADSADLHSVCRHFAVENGPFVDSVFLLRSSSQTVSMLTLNSVFEHGIDQTLAFSPSGMEQLKCTALGQVAKWQDAQSTDSLIHGIAKAIRRAQQDAIARVIAPLSLRAAGDYRVSFILGRAHEARGEFEEATLFFRQSMSLNRWFRPARAALAEVCLIMGNAREALELLAQLEREYGSDVDRKSALASAYIELERFDDARGAATAAEKLAPNHPRTIEALAQIHICTGEYDQAFRMIDRMKEVGPYFAAKLNDVGIKLSQSGNLKTAFSLYNKAHKVVRPDLQYKITMNAALACRKMQDYDMAMELVARCEQEYGGTFSKLEKLRSTLQIEKERMQSAG